MNLFFSDIELEIGKILAEHPERKDNPNELFEEVSGIKLGDNIKVHLHYYDGTNYPLILPPGLDEIDALSKENEALAHFLKSLSIDPTVSLEEQQPTLAQFVGALIALDASVLEQLKQSPKAVLEKYMEGNLPDDLIIKIIEFSDSNLHLSVPNKNVMLGELGEADLAQVAGGMDPHDAGAGAPAPAPNCIKDGRLRKKMRDATKKHYNVLEKDDEE